MDFSRVTAMSYGGRSVSSVWLKGVKVWPTTTTYYFPFRLIQDGSYLTWSQFQSETWDSIKLNNKDWNNEVTFTKNQVGHITDGYGNTVFYLSTTNSSYSGGGYVYLTCTGWEYTNGLLQDAATTNTLSAFNTAGINNIDSINIGDKPIEEGVLAYVESASWSAPVSWPNVYARVAWEIKYGDLTISTEVPDVIVESGAGGIVSGNWGENHSGSNWSVPSYLYGQTITLDYTLYIMYGSNYDDLMNGGIGLDETITGSFSWYVPVPAEGELIEKISPPDISANGRTG